MGVEKTFDSSLQRDARLDLSRALAISLVLVWHLQPIEIIGTNDHVWLSKILKVAVHFFYHQITLVAVPLFLLGSIYLFYQKTEKDSLAYLKKRCLRLAEVFGFWTFCQFVFFTGVSALGNGSDATSPFVISIPRLLMEGGPPLPIVGGSVFFFLFVLLLLVPVSYVTTLLREKENLVYFVSGAVIILSLLYFETANLKSCAIPYWRLDNFVVYVPLSYFLANCPPGKRLRFTPLLWIGFVLFSVQDVYLRHQGYDLGVYARASIVFGSTAIFSSLLQVEGARTVKAVSFLSVFSLGIFATHKYTQYLVVVMYRILGLAEPIHEMSRWFDWLNMTVAVSAALITFVVVFFLGHTRMKRFVM